MLSKVFKNVAAIALLGSSMATATGCRNTIAGPSEAAASEDRASIEQVVKFVEDGYDRIAASPDINGDGRVDSSDLAAFSWLIAKIDISGDGVINNQDRDLLAAALGTETDKLGWERPDLTGDGMVDSSDLAAFAGFIAQIDMTGDGTVDSRDLQKVRQQLGQEVTPT